MDVSIIISTFNYAKYIRGCIESCLHQTSHNLEYEVIVIDDGSTDNTAQICEDFLSEKLSVFRIENSGIEKACNFGFSLAKGMYVVRVDADDSLMSDYLSVVERYLETDFGFIYSDYKTIDSNGDFIKHIKLPEFDENEIFKRGDFLATGTLYKKDLIDELGGYDCSIKNCGLENYELVLRLIEHNVLGVHIPLPIFNYRRHLKNVSTLKQQEIITNGKNLFSQKGLGLFTTNEYHPFDLKVPHS